MPRKCEIILKMLGQCQTRKDNNCNTLIKLKKYCEKKKKLSEYHSGP